MLNELIDGE